MSWFNARSLSKTAKSAAASSLDPSRRRALALLALTPLAACGFTPVYAPDGVASDLRGRVNVDPPADEEGFALVRRLEDRLGAPEVADLQLGADIKLDEEAVGFLPDGTISRYHVLGEVRWTLSDINGPRLSGAERTFTAYSATSTTVATIVAQRDARERLMTILADRIVADILARSDSL